MLLVNKSSAHAGLIMSYFSFYIYKAIRKVLFLPFIRERSYKVFVFFVFFLGLIKVIFLVVNEISI